ncbi:hypothetical protein ACGFZG_25035 [Streptomyces antibioticus]|uniref:hypothetical protein n=1 Tax=Streptomyces TaxID=1883 RepID=UPI001587B0B4|nr:hypothetical protein [Streptomyces sp. CAI-85]NUV60650.1 hypothetical protein [Streptomyces sp. CAI-85]
MNTMPHQPQAGETLADQAYEELLAADQLTTAERFAAGLRGRGEGRLWVCSVPSPHMLAVNTGRDEDEIVVDTRGLQITEAGE